MTLSIGTDRPEQTAWTQIRCCMQHLTRVYPICHSFNHVAETLTVSKLDGFKFYDKYDKELNVEDPVVQNLTKLLANVTFKFLS